MCERALCALDNLDEVYWSFIYNKLFFKNISQLGEEKIPPKAAAIIYFFMDKFLSRRLTNFTQVQWILPEYVRL